MFDENGVKWSEMKISFNQKLIFFSFKDILINVLKTHVPTKTKILRANNRNLMTKALWIAIMLRSRFQNVYLKNQNTIDWSNYKYQRNFCTNLLWKTKFDYFHNLNEKDLNDNKKFWKKIKPFFSDKGLASNFIALKEKGSLISLIIKN